VFDLAKRLGVVTARLSWFQSFPYRNTTALVITRTPTMICASSSSTKEKAKNLTSKFNLILSFLFGDTYSMLSTQSVTPAESDTQAFRLLNPNLRPS
jgi:hypothetical protein